MSRYRSRVHELVDLVMQNPVVTVARVAEALGTTTQGARNLIRRMENEGFLQDVEAGRGTRHYFYAWDAVQALEVGPTDDANADTGGE